MFSKKVNTKKYCLGFLFEFYLKQIDILPALGFCFDYKNRYLHMYCKFLFWSLVFCIEKRDKHLETFIEKYF